MDKTGEALPEDPANEGDRVVKKLPPANDASNNAARIDRLTVEEWETACAIAAEASETHEGLSAMLAQQAETRCDLEARRRSIARDLAEASPDPLMFNPLAVPEAIRGENNLAPDGSGDVWSQVELLAMWLSQQVNEAMIEAARDPSSRARVLAAMRRALAAFGDFPTYSRTHPGKCSTAWAMLWLESARLAVDRVLTQRGPFGGVIECESEAQAAALVANEVRERIGRGDNGLSAEEVAIDLRACADFAELFALATLALRNFRLGVVDSINETANAIEKVMIGDAWPSVAGFRDVLQGRTKLPPQFDSVALRAAIALAGDVEARQHTERERARASAQAWQRMTEHARAKQGA